MAEIPGISRKLLYRWRKIGGSLGWTVVIAVCVIFRDSDILQLTLGEDVDDIIRSLALTREQKINSVNTIKTMIKKNYPVFNLFSTLDYYINNNWDRPCYQCIVSENKKRYTCGRCVEIDGLCENCGYLFAVEFFVVCKGNPKVIFDMIKTYLKYV